ncbi:unnamed protein product [Larinioides sclopetarius]|uniref:Uncharacterized protein n=1 Tax=Larinioides sclopetarius TaxID=280406 RepID=A0AAV1ZJC0_9ARAC
MDETKILESDKTDAPNEPVNSETQTEYSDILTQKLDTFKENQLFCEEFATELKHISKETKENSDSDLVEDKDESLHKKAIQVVSKAGMNQELDVFNNNQETCAEFVPKSKLICKGGKDNPSYHLEEDKDERLQKGTFFYVSSEGNSDGNAKGIKQEDADSSSKKKGDYIWNTVFKYLRVVTNPIEVLKNIKFVSKKDKKPNTFRTISNEILTKVQKYISQMGESKGISNEKGISKIKLEALEDSKKGITNIDKRKMKPDILPKLEMQSETSIELKDVTLPLCSTNSTSASKIPNNSETRPQAEKVRSAKEVLEHFRWFMQSNAKSLDMVESGDINKETAKKFKKFSESGTRSLDDPIKTITEPVCQELVDTKNADSNPTVKNFKDLAKEEMESVMAGNYRKVNNAVSVTEIDNSANLIKTTKNIPRQRIVYDEKIEYIRGWIIQQIKDREILLKFRIMEGKYSEDIETKMRCIEEAEDIQEEIDALFDTLDNSEKMSNIPKRMKGFSDFNQDELVKSPRKKKKDFKWTEGQIKSFLNLFDYLYKFSNSESNNKVFERLNPKKFKMAYDTYLVSKKINDRESKISENNARNAVDKFHISLLQSRSKVKCKIAYTEERCSEDYQNYVYDLQIAANENLILLQTLLPQVTSVILPLMSYLSQSQKKILKIFAFLNEERSDVFLASSDKYKAFFEEFCRQHFKI